MVERERGLLRKMAGCVGLIDGLNARRFQGTLLLATLILMVAIIMRDIYFIASCHLG
jgi:hypothetical protein